MGGRKLLSELPPAQRLAAARMHASSKMPYFTSGIQGLSPLNVPGLGTLGLSVTRHLLVDLEFMSKLFVDEASTMVLHEYLHDYLGHERRFQEMVRKGLLDKSDEALWNDAADAEINDNLEDAKCTFPRSEVFGLPPGEDGGITPTGLGLPVHRTAEEYAIALKKHNHKPRHGTKDSPGDLPPCGSGAGNPLPDEPDDTNPNAQTEEDRAVQRRATAEQVAQHAKVRGNVPMGILQTAEALLKPPKVRWEDELALEVRKSVRHKVGMIDYTFTERSRYQGAYELTFGEEAPVLPGMWAPMAKILLVIDTSGSMTHALERCLVEAHGILKSQGGARVTVVTCDAAVHALIEAKTIQEIQKNLLGGGGTDFRPAFDAIAGLPLNRKPDIVVFATDGYGAYPESEPKGYKTIWLCVDGEIGVDWGRQIHISTNESS